MRIVLATSSYLPRVGEHERHVDRLASGLARRGATVEVLVHGPAAAVDPLIERNGFVVRRFAPVIRGRRLSISSGLWDALRLAADSSDLVHVNASHPAIGLSVMRAGFRRMVFTPHGAVRRFASWPYLHVSRRVVLNCSQVICRSHFEGDLLRRAFPMQRSRIQVVPAGVDGAAIRAAVPLPTEGRLVLTVGRLRRARRVDRLISAMASLGSEYRLAIIGEGPERRRLEAYAADLQVSHRVRFLGSLPDAELHRWLRTARVVVALSEDHGSISQVSEGLVAGAAVVASDLPIHREAGECGPGRVWFVRPTGSPLAVADAIVEAARAELATSSGISAAPTWESMVDRIWTLYSRLLGPTPIARLVNAAHTTSTAATGLPSDSAGHGFTAQVTRS